MEDHKKTLKTPSWVAGKAFVQCEICFKPKIITKTEWERSDSKKFFCCVAHLGKWRSETTRQVKKEQRQERNRPVAVHCYHCGIELIRPAFRVHLGARFQCENTACLEERKVIRIKAANEYKTKRYREDPTYREQKKEKNRGFWEKVLKDDEKHTKYNARKREIWKKLIKKYPERYLSRTKKKTGQITVGQLIKHKVLAEPTWGTKSLWNGVGEWSKKYPEFKECVECNTTMYIHRSRGVCAKCYEKLRFVSEETKEKKRIRKEERKQEYALNRKRRVAEAKDFLRKAKSGELDIQSVEIEQIVMNLLDNLEREEGRSREEILATLYSEREHSENLEYGNMEYGGAYLKKYTFD